MFSAKYAVENGILRGKMPFLWSLWYPYGTLVVPKMQKNAKNTANMAISCPKNGILPAVFAFLRPYGTLVVPWHWWFRPLWVP